MIFVNDELTIPDHELKFTASRSGGPGGQNVNKVSSRVTLSFDVARSTTLSDDQRRRISDRLAGRINDDGVLRVVSQRTRSQDLNRKDATERFAELLRRSLRITAPRRQTKIPASAHQKRLDEKKKRTEIKRTRAKTSRHAE